MTLPAYIDALLELSPQEQEELHVRALELKQKATTLYNSKDFTQAHTLYNQAKELTNDASLTSILLNNMSACSFHCNKLPLCIDECNEAIDLNQEYLNPRVRRVKACLKVNSIEMLEIACKDVEYLLDRVPEHQVKDWGVQNKLKEARRKEQQEMLDKLVSLGDGILDGFGLSRDMFQMNQKSDGSYTFSTR